MEQKGNKIKCKRKEDNVHEEGPSEKRRSIEEGPRRRLGRVRRRRFDGEGPLEKAFQRRPIGEGPQRRSIGEGLSEKVHGKGMSKKVRRRRPDGEGPSEKMAAEKEGSL